MDHATVSGAGGDRRKLDGEILHSVCGGELLDADLVYIHLRGHTQTD